VSVKSSDLFEMELTPEEACIVDECIPVKSFKKGTVLLSEGKVANTAYYVVKGLVRAYLVKDDGEERTTRFMIENEPCVNLDSYVNQTPSTYYLECMEDCELSVVTQEKEKELSERFPPYQELCKMDIEKQFGKAQNELAQYIVSKPEERYTELLETRPELIQRVPQYHLASFLGITPESLSRMRKRLANR